VNVSFGTIAKQLKTIRPHITYYFKNMDELIDESLRFVIANIQSLTVENLKEATDPKERLIAIVRSIFQWARQFPDHIRLFLLFHYLCSIDQNRRFLHTEIRRVGRDRMAAALEPYVFSKQISRMNLIRLTHEIQNLVLGNVFEYFVVESEYSLKEQEEQTVKEVMRFLGQGIK